MSSSPYKIMDTTSGSIPDTPKAQAFNLKSLLNSVIASLQWTIRSLGNLKSTDTQNSLAVILIQEIWGRTEAWGCLNL